MFLAAALALAAATVLPIVALAATRGLPRLLGLGLALDAASALAGLAGAALDAVLDSI